MRERISSVCTNVLLVAVLLLSGCSAGPFGIVSPRSERSSTRRVSEAYGALPVAFEENRGQASPEVRFLSRGRGYVLFLTPTGAMLSLRKPAGPGAKAEAGGVPLAAREETPETTALRMKLVGANGAPRVSGEDELAGQSNYFIGEDPAAWRTEIPNYARVRYESVYPGVDLVYYGSNQRQLEYDFVVAPGAEPSVIRLAFEGMEGLRLDDSGNLVLETGRGEVIQKAPLVYQEVDGLRKTIRGAYELLGESEVGFQVAAYDRERPLIIDPVLAYSTYLGGNDFDMGYGIDLDGAGNAYVTGGTVSLSFPTASPIQAAKGGKYDAFVTKIDATGTALVYSTYLGGGDWEEGYAIAVDESGNAFVSGFTSSTDFPTANPIQAANRAGTDAFLAKIDPTGSTLVYSTYLGGTGNDAGHGNAVDGSGNVYLTGGTSSTNFPTANPIQPAKAGDYDAFVTKVDPTGSALVYSTYLGGSGDYGYEAGYAIAVDASGNAYVTGQTYSNNFPTASPVQASHAGGRDAFVAKLDATGSALVYSTYLGGTALEEGYAIAVDASGSAYVTGQTYSNNFPTASPVQASPAGDREAFVTKLDPTGSALVYSTYLGGSKAEEGTGIAVDESGNAYVAGATMSPDFPTASPIQGTHGGWGSCYDAFVTKLDPTGSAFVYSTYLGGRLCEGATSIAIDGSGSAYVAGVTSSTDFPTANPIQPVNAGGADAFVAKITLCGDGIIDAREECDDGELNGTTAGCCSSACTLEAFGTPCDDGNGCTQTDTCDEEGLCTGSDPIADGTPCDDGNACTTADTCSGGFCLGGAPPECDDGNVCTDDTCAPEAGCTHTSNAAPCDDGNVCTTSDVCQQGVCAGGAPLECGDGNVCTDDSCDPGAGCMHTNNAASCDDGNACSSRDTCSAGTCIGGPPLDCDDGNACTDDSCSPAAGCTHANNTAPCDDGNACTQTDTCDGFGVCEGSHPVVCAALDQCHDAGTCDPATGACSTPEKPDGEACDDADACTRIDSCVDGMCVGADPVVCKASDPCHARGTCDPSTGECSNPSKRNGTHCNDGDPCTLYDTCQEGICEPGSPTIENPIAEPEQTLRCISSKT